MRNGNKNAINPVSFICSTTHRIKLTNYFLKSQKIRLKN